MQVSEIAAKHSTVVTVAARDPEGSPVQYRLVGGNSAQQFTVGESTGVVRVMQPLDREDTRRYSLVSRALSHESIFSAICSQVPETWTFPASWFTVQ